MPEGRTICGELDSAVQKKAWARRSGKQVDGSRSQCLSGFRGYPSRFGEAGIGPAKARSVQQYRLNKAARASDDRALFLRLTLIDICCGPPVELGV